VVRYDGGVSPSILPTILPPIWATILGATVALPQVAAAASPVASPPSLASIEVRRAPEAAGCPDAVQLGADLAAITGAERRFVASAGAPVGVEVMWDRLADGGFRASLRLDGAREGIRTLTDEGPTCDALGHAVAIALALALDSDAPGPRPVKAVSATEPGRPPAAAPLFTAGHVALLAGPSRGQVGQMSGAGRLELGLRSGRTSLVVGAERVLSRTTAVAPGTVEVSLWGGRLALCALLDDPSSWVRVDACAVGAVGALHGQGQGYPTSGATTLLWWAAGGELRAEAVFRGRWLIALSTDVAATLYDYTFSVAQVGAIRGSNRWTGQLLAGVGVKLW
jgi:hypothetical protein